MVEMISIFRKLTAPVFLALVLFVPGAIAQQNKSQTPSVAVELTPLEKAWLAKHHIVRARVSDYPPYMLIQPEPSGIAVDYLTAAAKRFGFQVEFVADSGSFQSAMEDVKGPRQHYDVLLTFTRSPEREKQFAVTADYLTAPWVVYVRRDSPYIIGLESLNGKKLVGEKGFLITNKIKADYRDIRFLEVAKSEDALLAVATGQADAYVGNLAYASYVIKVNRLDNLVVTAPVPYGLNTQAMAVRSDWPELAGLITKGIAAMTPEERNAISQKWGVAELKVRIDYTLIWEITVVSLLIILAFLYWNRKLAHEIALRKQAEVAMCESAAQVLAERDLLEQRVMERTVHLSEALEFNEAILINSPLPMSIYAESGQCVIVNEAYAKFLGVTREALLAQNFHDVTSWQETDLLGDCLTALKCQTFQQREVNLVTPLGKEVFFEYRILPKLLKGEHHLLIQFIDLTERKRMEDDLRHSAFHDFLTRLPNRRQLHDRLIQALRLSKRKNSYLAVLFIDLNRFKQLNDSYGHDIGDQMLVEVANRLRQVVRESDTVARLGGDEFVVLISDLSLDAQQAQQYAQSIVEKIHSALSQDYLFGTLCYQGSASVGAKLIIGNDADPDQILKEADAAMYEIKRSAQYTVTEQIATDSCS
ncbi:diguanylate cyclase [uncultured Thiodictyon sp.]|uniref:diguanylate cyclase domain-containing protein n=1 Tax=uncultured Thiodictyon sp. TaxID=1846217 RepID=UPI0025ED01DE|nr:diguanylate cyclase [uncultured Thiodictyon sp.]